jgi:hypothetical protein
MKNLILFTTLLITATLSLSSCALLQGRQSQYDKNSYQRRIASAVVRQDLILGMAGSDVRQAWGSPEKIETAGGIQESAAERWVYVHGLTHAQGMRDMAEKRIVYFQNGAVVGWETQR